MNRARARIILTVVAGSFLGAAGVRADSELFRDGRSSWRVVTGENPAPEIAYAAQEFTNAVFRVSGALLPVVAAADRCAEVVEIVARGPDVTDIDERIGYCEKDGRLLLVGNQPRAALHATYQFLQRELGVRWISPGPLGEIYPPRREYRLPKGLRYAHVPSIRYRGFHICGGDYRRAEVYAWMARNGATVHRHGARERDRKYGFYSMLGAHDACLHPKYFAEHPEWFSEFKGVRTKDNFCFASEGAFEKVFEEVCRTIDWGLEGVSEGRKVRGDVDIMGVFPSDTRRHCQCAICAKKSVSENWFAYYNRLVKRLRAKYPKTFFTTLAYQEYRRHPAGVVPDALFVEYARHGRCHAHELGDETCADNVADTSAFEEWRKAGVPMGAYTYELKTFAKRTVWLPLFTIADDLVARAEADGQISLIPETGMTTPQKPKPEPDLNLFKNRFVLDYMLAKMYDRNVKLEDWLADTTRAAFGPAAEPIRSYFLAMDAAWRRQPRHPGMLGNIVSWVHEILTPETLAEARRLLEEAEAALPAGESVYRANVARERELFAQWEDALRLHNGEGADFAAPPERTLLYYLGNHAERGNAAAKVAAKDHGWRLLVCTNATQAMAAIPQANHVWFRYCRPGNVPPEILPAIRAKVRAGGAWLVSSFWEVPLSSFTGEADWSCEMAKLEKLPTALRRPITVRPGSWQTTPNDLSKVIKSHVTPAYVLKGTGDGWTGYMTAKGRHAPEEPYLSTHPYGKGLVVLMGDNLHFPIYKLLENLIHENTEKKKK